MDIQKLINNKLLKPILKELKAKGYIRLASNISVNYDKMQIMNGVLSKDIITVVIKGEILE